MSGKLCFAVIRNKKKSKELTRIGGKQECTKIKTSSKLTRPNLDSYLSCEVLEDGGKIHRRTSTYTVGVLPSLEKSCNTADGELKPRKDDEWRLFYSGNFDLIRVTSFIQEIHGGRV
jgi:hypothetical protein